MRILIDNALTHTPEGTAIKVGTQTENGSASVVVADDGPGIDARKRDRVFERFYTGDEVSGSGLGLAIARELALRMEGSFELRTRSGSHRVRAPAAGEPRGARLDRAASPIARGARRRRARARRLRRRGARRRAPPRPTTSPTAAERVVIEAADGAFDSQTIYEAASPGVVTVRLGLRQRQLDPGASSGARGPRPARDRAS